MPEYEKQVQVTAVLGSLILLLLLPSASQIDDQSTDNPASGLCLVLGLILLVFGLCNHRHLKPIGRLVILTAMGISVSVLLLLAWLEGASKLTGKW